MSAVHAFILFLCLAPGFSLAGILIYQYRRLWRGVADDLDNR